MLQRRFVSGYSKAQLFSSSLPNDGEANIFFYNKRVTASIKGKRQRHLSLAFRNAIFLGGERLGKP